MDLTKLPDFEIIDLPQWKDFQEKMCVNWYGEQVLEFAARWAHAMEAKIAEGATVAKCAEKTAIELDREMRTENFVYGHAVEVLVRVWKHRRELAQVYADQGIVCPV